MVERTLTPSEKGAIAEARTTAEAIRLGISVARPVIGGARYDLVFDLGPAGLRRAQCKWGRLEGDRVVAQIATCRHSPTRGYVRTSYSADKIDAFAIYCDDLKRYFYVPIDRVVARSQVHLRLTPARNNQRVGVTLADEYDLGAVAQLGERRHGMAEVRGSSPLSSTS